MTFNSVARIRRFNRAVTSQIGALDHSFLGRGRPLGVARVLHAIGHFGSDISIIRTRLNLDKAVLSRHLKGLEAEGLIRFETDPKDARKRQAVLTPEGEAEFAAYNTLSDAHAERILSRHPHPDAVLEAMDLVATALTKDQWTITLCDPQTSDAVSCLESYYGELAQRLDRGFDVSLSCDPEAKDMMPPHGAFFIVQSDGLALGCCGLKGTHKGYAEIKRLWVAPSARGLGLARRLLEACEAQARAQGISLLRLDTNSALPEAAGLYQKSGWTQIDRFNDDPYPDLFFEKKL